MSRPEHWGVEVPGGYFDEPNHRYRNIKGVIVPSPTKAFDMLGLSDFSKVNQEDLEWKRNYGSQVHKAVEYLVTDDLDWDFLDDEIIAPVTGIETRLRELEFVPDAVEERRVATVFGMEYGMTLDLRGTITHQAKRRKAVIDLKTGTKYSKTWDWQIGAYVWPQEKVPLGWIGLALQIDRTGDVTPHYVADIEKAKREYQVILAAAILKLNYGFAAIGG